MYTDIPLKRLTLLRAADLLPLLGLPNTQVLSVETLELPKNAQRLDNVLTLRSTQGTDFLHVIEWQGYEDAALLWRFAGYLAWIGQEYPDKIITGTIIYLNKRSDVGDTIRQTVDDHVLLEWPIHCIRLWQQDAHAALASGKVGLAVLSPLMHDATETLVQTAMLQILNQTTRPQQADLLSILAIFAEPILDVKRLIEGIGKERFMASDLISYLMEDKLAEIQTKLKLEYQSNIAQLEAEQADRIAQLEAEQAKQAEQAQREAEQAHIRGFQSAIEEAISIRFPNAPIALINEVRRITQLTNLHRLLVETIRAADLATFQQTLAAMVASNGHA